MERQVLSTVPEKECEIFDLADNNTNVEWTENGQAFYLDGIMYDVVKNHTDKNGKKKVYCIKETEEMKLIYDISLKISQNPDNSACLFGYVFADDFMMPETLKETPVLLPINNYPTHSQQTADGWKNVILCPPRSNAI